MLVPTLLCEIIGREIGRVVGNNPERHLERVHGAQHIHLPPRALNEDHRRHLLIHIREHAKV